MFGLHELYQKCWQKMLDVLVMGDLVLIFKVVFNLALSV
jgi:hypothetical protein